jgi:hypothetical protein
MEFPQGLSSGRTERVSVVTVIKDSKRKRLRAMIYPSHFKKTKTVQFLLPRKWLESSVKLMITKIQNIPACEKKALSACSGSSSLRLRSVEMETSLCSDRTRLQAEVVPALS